VVNNFRNGYNTIRSENFFLSLSCVEIAFSNLLLSLNFAPTSISNLFSITSILSLLSVLPITIPHHLFFFSFINSITLITLTLYSLPSIKLFNKRFCFIFNSILRLAIKTSSANSAFSAVNTIT